MPSPRIPDEPHRGPPQPPGPSAQPCAPSVAPGPPATSVAVRLTRYGLPAAILLAGVILAVAVPGETGLDAVVGLSGVCACVVLLNLLLRLGASGDRDRVREAAARLYYDEHGRWPDEGRPRPRTR